MKRKWITKAGISKILKTYSIRKNEFQPVGESGYLFQSSLVNGYVIQIEQETIKGEKTVKTNRILVTHSQSNGKKTYVDIWHHDPNGDLQFRFRNLWNQPPADADYIQELEQQNMQLRQAGRKLQEQLDTVQHEQNISHKLINDTDPDDREKLINLRQQINDLNQKYHKLIHDTNIHNARGAGRKPSQERLDTISQVKSLLNAGCSNKDIMNQLQISRATFYRYKRSISATVEQN